MENERRLYISDREFVTVKTPEASLMEQNTRRKLQEMKLGRSGAKLVRTLLIPDMHIPHQDPQAVKTLFNFIADNHFDNAVIVGDLLDFVGVSKYRGSSDPREQCNIQQEIDEAKGMLDAFRDKLGKDCKMYYIEGNHEQRLNKFLYKEASPLVHLKKNDEDMLSVPYLLDLKQRDITFVPAYDTLELSDWNIEHGDKVSQFAAYTAKKMLDSRRKNTIIGHTHRSGVYNYTSLGGTQTAVELGCLIDFNSPAASYTKRPNWQHGFGVMEHYPHSHFTQVTPIVMQNYQFLWYGKLYCPEGVRK